MKNVAKILISVLLLILCSLNVLGAMTDNLMSYYTFDNNNNDSMGKYNATFSNATIISGIISNATNFTRTRKQQINITTGAYTGLSTNSTISFWIWRATSSSEQHMFSTRYINNTDSPILTAFINDAFYSYFVDGYGSACNIGAYNFPIPTNSWHMITIMRNVTNVSLYYDGVLNYSQECQNITLFTINSNNMLTGIGFRPLSTTVYFDGKVDELGIWNRSMTSTEIATLYNDGDGLSYPFNLLSNLYSYYTFNEQTGGISDSLMIRNLTQTGTVPNQTGKINNARGVYSNSNYFSTTTSFVNNTDFSINFWMYRTSNLTASWYIDYGNADGNFKIMIGGNINDTVRLYLSRHNQVAYYSIYTPVIPLNNWTMVTVTFNKTNGEGKIYMNSVLSQNATASISGTTLGTELHVGASNSHIDAFTSGYLDEVASYTRTLSQSDINTLYNGGGGLSYPFTCSSNNLSCGLVSYYNFNGNANDGLSINNGSATGAVNSALYGKMSQGYSFNSSTDKVVVPSSTSLGLVNDFSFGFWIYSTATTPNAYIISKTSAGFTAQPYILYLATNSKFSLYMGNGASQVTVEVDTAIVKDTWYHVTVTKSGNTVTFYYNGTQTGASKTLSAITSTNSAESLYITNAANNGAAFYGYMDEIGIWNKSLTSTEVSSLFNNGTGFSYPFTPPLPASIDNSGYTTAYTNEFMAPQEFFAGSYVTDDDDDLDRQYCPPGLDGYANTSSTCYEQKGYREGSQRLENWIWIETNLTLGTTPYKVTWWNGIQWNTTSMTTGTDFKYLRLQNLGNTWQTFYITDNNNNLLLNYTKPSALHPVNKNRLDEYKYVSFGITPSTIDYTNYYLRPLPWKNTTAFNYCQNAPGGNLFDCMSVEYWGTMGMSENVTGTKYDRGELFRGGMFDGDVYDTGVMTSTLPLDRPKSYIQSDYGLTNSTETRYCFAFTDSYINESLYPTNNITNYYFRFWQQDAKWSTYLGITQDVLWDYIGLFKWQYDTYTYTRDWSAQTDTKMNNSEIMRVMNVPPSMFGSDYNETLIVGYKDGFNFDATGYDIYQIGVQTDGQWNNYLTGRNQRALVIFNLPDNATLQSYDTDSDGYSDFDELYTYYTDPFYEDTGETGWNDGFLLDNGYNPNNLSSHPAPTLDVDFDSSPPNDTVSSYTMYDFFAEINTPSGIRNASINIYTTSYALINTITNNYNDSPTYIYTEFINVSFSEGNTYYWTMDTSDIYGVTNTTSYYTLTISNTSPVINVISPVNDTKVNYNNLSFTANMSDNYKLQNVSLYILTQTNTLLYTHHISLSNTSTATTIFNQTMPGDGWYYYYYNVTDLAGNRVVTQNYYFGIQGAVNTTNYNVSFPYQNEVITNNKNLTVTFSTNDTYYDYANYSLLNYTNNQTTSTATTSKNYTWSNLSDGKYYYSIRVYDMYGNSHYYDPNVTIDTTPPNITFNTNTTPENINIPRSNPSIYISVDSSDDNLNETRINLYDSNNTLINMTSSMIDAYTNVVGVWHLDDASGINALEVIQSNNGTLYNGPIWTTGKFLNATNFDGINDYIRTNNNSGITNYPFSISAWVNPSINTSTKGVASINNPGSSVNFFVIGMFSTGTAYMEGRAGGASGDSIITGTSQLPIGSWSHIVGVFENETVRKLYINGVLENRSTTTSISYISAAPSIILIGEVRLIGGGNFNGSIDEVNVFKTNLSSASISSMYNGGIGSVYKVYNGTVNNLSVNFTNLLPGLYYINASAVDYAGNTNSTSTRLINIYNNSGNGTSLDPFLVTTRSELDSVRYGVNQSYKLMNNIDLQSIDFTTIGNMTSNLFNGSFNGNGYVIRNYYSTSGALFGVLLGNVSSLGLENVSGNIYGGMVNLLAGIINESYTTGSITGYGANTGGLVGIIDGGPFVQFGYGQIINSYARTDTIGGSGNARYAGGLVGNNRGSITTSYSTGQAVASWGGGFTGGNNGGAGSFWDVNTSGLLNGDSGIYGPSAATGLSTPKMKMTNFYEAAGWDLNNTWQICPSINDGYPSLRVFGGYNNATCNQRTLLNTTAYNVTFPYTNNAYTTNNTLTYGFNTSDEYYNYTTYTVTNQATNITLSTTTTDKNYTYTLPDGKYYYALRIYDVLYNNYYYDPNITIDTTNPGISYNSNTTPSNTITNQTNIYVSVTSSDANLNETRINLYNSNNTLINTTNTTLITNNGTVNNLVAYYGLDEGIGITSGNTYHYDNFSVTSFNLINNATWSPGIIGNSLSRSYNAGQYGYGDLGNISSLGYNFTINLFIKPINQTSSEWNGLFGLNQNLAGLTVMYQNNYFHIYDYNAGGSYINASYNLTNNTWYMFTITRTYNELFVYVNGVLIINEGGFGGAPPWYSTYNFYLGLGPAIDYNYTHYWQGSLDEVSMWNTSLSNTNILDLYNNYLKGINPVIPTSTLSVNFTNLLDGVYYYNATTNDYLGHTNNTETRNATIHPVFNTSLYNIVFPYPNNAYTTNNTLTYGFTTSDEYYSHTIYSLTNHSTNTTITDIHNTTGYCYQPLANKSSCGTNSSVAYYNPSWSNTPLAFDEDWNTYAYPYSFTSSVNINISLPSTSYNLDSNTLIQIKVGNGTSTQTVNLSLSNINSGCITYANTTRKLELTIRHDNVDTYTLIYCKYSPSLLAFTGIGNLSGTTNLFYEMSTLWYKPPTNNTYILQDGKYYYDLRIFDKAGNSNYYDPNITVDTTNPSLSFITPPTETNNSLIDTRSIIFVSVNASDTNYNYTEINFYNYNNTLLQGYNTTSQNVTNTSFNVSSNGVYYFNATTHDSANLSNSTETRMIIIDSYKENITFTGYERTTNSTIPFNVYILNATNTTDIIVNFTVNNRTLTRSLVKTDNLTHDVVFNKTGYYNCVYPWVYQNNYTFPTCEFYTTNLTFTAHNSYTNATISNFTTSLSLGGYTENQTANGTNTTFKVLNTQSYGLVFTHPSYLTKTRAIFPTGISQDLNVSLNQSIITLRFKHAHSGEIINNINITMNDTTIPHEYNTSTGIIIFNPSTGNHTLTINGPPYINNTYNLVVTDQQIATIDINMYPVLNISIYEEKQSMISLSYFNFSHPRQFKWTVYCMDENKTDTGTQQAIVPNTTSGAYFLNVTCYFERVKFDLEYLNLDGTTWNYYRNVIFTPTITTFDFRAFIPDLALGYSIYQTTLKPYDVFGVYTIESHTIVQVHKIMPTGTELITSDYMDAEGKITAYLVAGDSYIITILSDNKPARILGPYTADSTGTKILRLFDVTLTGGDVTALGSEIYIATTIENVTDTSGIVVMQFADTQKVTSEVILSIYNNTCNTRTEPPLLTDTLDLTELTLSAFRAQLTYNVIGSPYMNKSSNIKFCAMYNYSIYDNKTSNIVTYQSLTDVVYDKWIERPGDFQSEWTFPWIFILILIMISLGLNARTASIGSILITVLAGVVFAWGWLRGGSISQQILGIAIGVALIIAIAWNIKRQMSQ